MLPDPAFEHVEERVIGQPDHSERGFRPPFQKLGVAERLEKRADGRQVQIFAGCGGLDAAAGGNHRFGRFQNIFRGRGRGNFGAQGAPRMKPVLIRSRRSFFHVGSILPGFYIFQNDVF